MKNPEMTAALYEYMAAHNPAPHPILTELAEITRRRPDSNMQISPDQGSFMHLLVALTASKKVVEVGCYTGYSAICMASALGSDGVLYTLDVNEDTSEIAKAYFQKAGLSERIRLRLGPALTSLQGLEEELGPETVDMVFIDADKENYEAYYRASMRLLRPGGLLIADNVLWGGSVLDEQDLSPSTVAIRQFNESVRQDNGIVSAMVPIADGLYLAVKGRKK